MSDSVKDRIISYLDAKGISKAEFGRKIGVSGAYITSMRKSIQPDKLKIISAEFPDLNTAWLLTGEGEMFTAAPSAAVPPDAAARIAELETEVQSLRAQLLDKAEEIISLQRQLLQRQQ